MEFKPKPAIDCRSETKRSERQTVYVSCIEGECLDSKDMIGHLPQPHRDRTDILACSFGPSTSNIVGLKLTGHAHDIELVRNSSKSKLWDLRQREILARVKEQPECGQQLREL